MPVTDAQAEKFGEEIADIMDLALDKISNKTQINDYFKHSMDIYGEIAGMDFSDAQRAALAFHVGAAIMARSKKYFPLNPPAPTPVQ